MLQQIEIEIEKKKKIRGDENTVNKIKFQVALQRGVVTEAAAAGAEAAQELFA